MGKRQWIWTLLWFEIPQLLLFHSIYRFLSPSEIHFKCQGPTVPRITTSLWFHGGYIKCFTYLPIRIPIIVHCAISQYRHNVYETTAFKAGVFSRWFRNRGTHFLENIYQKSFPTSHSASAECLSLRFLCCSVKPRTTSWHFYLWTWELWRYQVNPGMLLTCA